MEELIRIRRITNLPIVVIGGINRGSFAEAVQYTIDLVKLSEKVEEMVKDMGVKLVFQRSYIFPVWKITVYWNCLMSAVPRMK